jgi:putative NADPH-quinone reductase
MKRILIINGHPDKESLCFALAERHKKGADTWKSQRH